MGHDVAVVGVRGQVKVDRDRAAALHAQAVTGDGQRARVAQAAINDSEIGPPGAATLKIRSP